MYPSIPIGGLGTEALPATGIAIASLLLIASALVLAGLLMLRSSRIVQQQGEA